VEVEGMEEDEEEEEEEDDEMQYDDEDEEIEEDMDDEDGSLGLDQLQVHTVDLGDENAQPADAPPPPALATTATQPRYVQP
jgi:hypothetical protein